jgi:hypothetical protein
LKSQEAGAGKKNKWPWGLEYDPCRPSKGTGILKTARLIGVGLPPLQRIKLG